MADIPTDALLNVLRRAAQVEDGAKTPPWKKALRVSAKH